jgi:hypothetical protein
MLNMWRTLRSQFWMASAFFVASCLFFHVVTALTYSDWSRSLVSENDCHWDCLWYASIVDLGYMADQSDFIMTDYAHLMQVGKGNWAFFPVFPLLAKAVQLIFGMPTWAALLISSKLFFWISIFLFVLVATRRFGDRAGPLAATLVAFNPYLVYGHVGYSEPLYFTLTMLGFLSIWNNKWLAAGWLTAVLSATRLVGLSLVFSLLLKLIRKRIFSEGVERRTLVLLALALCPLGIALFTTYLHFHMGDALAFMNVQIAWGRSFQIPLDSLITALLRADRNTYFALCAIAGLAMAVWLYRHQQIEEAVFLGITVLIPLMTGVLSMPRFVFWQFPFLWGVLQFSLRYPLFKTVYVTASLAMGLAMVGIWYGENSFVV